MTLPARMRGDRVVSAYKRPAQQHPAHRWDIILEEFGGTAGTFAIARLTHSALNGFELSQYLGGLAYPQATELWLRRING